MKKLYEKPQAEVVIVRCKDKLLYDETMADPVSNPYTHADAKENQIFGEDDEMQEWNDIFSNDRKDPWDGADDIWK